jgi:hypothetical protein
MVGLWNPTYFESDYCNREWYSFWRRAKSTQRRVLFGASWYDGTYFPNEAQSLQLIDISKFTRSSGPGLRQSQNYPEFNAAVEVLARNVAQAVKDAPPFEDWPIADRPAPQRRRIGLTRL